MPRSSRFPPRTDSIAIPTMIYRCSNARTALLSLLAASCSTPMGLPVGHDIGMELANGPMRRLAVVDASPEEFAFETLLIEARVRRVCPTQGCWMQIEDEGHTAMVRWEAGCGGQYAFPRDAVGKRVLIQGSLCERKITEPEAKELEAAADARRRFPRVAYEINASGVRILDD